MANVGKSFISSLQKSMEEGAQHYYAKERAEDTLRRQEALKDYQKQITEQEEQEQNRIMAPLLSGKVFQIAAGHYPGERPITEKERRERLLQLNPKGLTKYKSLKEITGDTEGYNKIGDLLGLNKPEVIQNIAPEVQDRISRTISANKLMGVKPETTFKEIQELIYPKISKTVEHPHSRTHIYSNGREETVPYEGEGINPAYKPTWREAEIPGTLRKEKSGRYVQDIGLYDASEDFWSKGKGDKYNVVKTKRMKLTSTGTNGEKLFSKELNEHFKKYKTDINNILKAINNNVNPETGEAFTDVEKNQYVTKLGAISSNYSQEIKNTAPPSFLNWYKQIYNATGGNKKAKTNPDKNTYWNELMKAYRKGNISSKGLQAGYNLYLSTYLSNPLLENSINEDYVIDEQEEEQTNDDEE